MTTPESSPVPIQAARLVAYQPGSIVSRMLLKKEAGSVTVFAFDEGQGLSEHTAPFDALVLMLEGQGRFQIEETNYVLESGDTLVLPAKRPHSVKAPGRFKMMLVMIRSEA